MMLEQKHRRAAVELMLGAGAGRIDPGMLAKSRVTSDLALAMVQAGLLVQDPTSAWHWMLTVAAHRFINRAVAESQDMLASYCSP